MADNGSSKLSVIDFLKLLVLLYAALIPAGLWVRGEIKGAIDDAVTSGRLVAAKDLDARERLLRQELEAAWSEGLGPIVSYIAAVDARVSKVTKDVNAIPPPTSLGRTIVRERLPGGKERTWEWTTPKKGS